MSGTEGDAIPDEVLDLAYAVGIDVENDEVARLLRKSWLTSFEAARLLKLSHERLYGIIRSRQIQARITSFREGVFCETTPLAALKWALFQDHRP